VHQYDVPRPHHLSASVELAMMSRRTQRSIHGGGVLSPLAQNMRLSLSPSGGFTIARGKRRNPLRYYSRPDPEEHSHSRVDSARKSHRHGFIISRGRKRAMGLATDE